ncbi:MAG: hypothetical protein EPN93_08310 [Spirochaetes bacterium]|nr:MAG: hypothetical protein EPN93_08310 [Spirochaetota bacterium]
MRNKLKNIALTYGLNLLFTGGLIGVSIFFFHERLEGRALILFFFVLIISLLPLLNYLRTSIDLIISPIRYSDLYIQTVDSILSLESYDEVLRETFDQILNLIKVKSGLLIFYYQDKDEFNIFYQRDRRKRTIRKARIMSDNILFKVIGGPDDIIIKGKLNPSIHFENTIITELENIGGEIVVPIYYHEMFLGLIITGERRRWLSDNEIRLLKIFASKIAILSVNAFLFNEMVKKKQLEKEYELAGRVQKKFLPHDTLSAGRVSIAVFHEPGSLIIREYYDVFQNELLEDDVRVSAYRIRGNITGTSIIMPGVQAVVQSFARMGFPPARVLSRLNRTARERGLQREELAIIHGSVHQGGEFNFINDRYAPPLVFRKRDGRLQPVRPSGKGPSQSLKIHPGDACIIACGHFYELIEGNAAFYSDFIARHADATAARLRTLLAGELKKRSSVTGLDSLLIVIRLEEGRQ